MLRRNLHVHNTVLGALATERKDELQAETEMQQKLGEEVLAEEDKYLLKINLEDLETTSEEKQTYWLLAIQLMQEGRRLKAQALSAASANTT